MSDVVFFDQSDSAGVSLVGGKGANLILLTAAGFPVPGGFVVTAGAYRRFLESAPWLRDRIDALDYAHPDRLREQCQTIRQRLCQSDLPGDLRQSIRTALQRVNAATPDATFAVRSSSTFEDLANAAFAGQHDTYLNVRGIDSICERVRACFASLWEDRAVLYRNHQGFSQLDASMAVVVQRQIQCDAAGVGFSIDPVHGRMDRIVVNANYGIGESVVSGEGEIDQFEIDKSTLQIINRTIGHKEHKVVSRPDGSVESRAIPADMADRPCISDEQLLSVARLLKRVEDHYGWPQDIEWGIESGQVHLLQSRAVTTIQPEWTRDESAERFPNPMTPLSWDFISVAFSASMSHSLALMGLPVLKGNWFQTFEHYVYGNQNAVRLMAMFRPLKARNAAELVAEIPVLRRRFMWVQDLPVNWARDLDRYLLRLGRLQARPEPANLQEAWRFTTDVLDAAADYFRPNIAISMTQSALHRLLHGLIAMVIGQAKSLEILDGLLSGCQTKTAIVNREIHDLAELASQTPALSKELKDLGGRPFFDSQRMNQYPAFAERFTRFIEDHGHREVDMDYSHPTWSGQPWIVLDSVALLLRAPQAQNPADAMRAGRLRYAQTEQQFLAAVPEELRFFFRELIALTRTYTILDDLEHYQTTRINPLAHRAALTMGGMLRDLHVLDDPADVFFLNKTDLEKLVADCSPQTVASTREKALANKASYQAAASRTPPWSLRAVPPDAAAPTPTNLLRGLPGSPGRATGKCFLVRGPQDFAGFPDRAVLVARTTNPAWTSLFYAASAVVTESGGPLSHGAVTAREMGLPAVMSVRGAMSLFRNGQTLTVDGTAGTVEIADA